MTFHSYVSLPEGIWGWIKLQIKPYEFPYLEDKHPWSNFLKVHQGTRVLTQTHILNIQVSQMAAGEPQKSEPITWNLIPSVLFFFLIYYFIYFLLLIFDVFFESTEFLFFGFIVILTWTWVVTYQNGLVNRKYYFLLLIFDVFFESTEFLFFGFIVILTWTWVVTYQNGLVNRKYIPTESHTDTPSYDIHNILFLDCRQFGLWRQKCQEFPNTQRIWQCFVELLNLCLPRK